MRRAAFLICLLFSTRGFCAGESELGIGFLNLKNVTWIYVGADIGYNELNTQVAGENRKRGPHLQFKLSTRLLQFGAWDLDTGLGWFYAPLSRDNGTVKVGPHAAFLELSLRYKWTARWHIGPTLLTYYAKNANFGETVRNQTIVGLFGPSFVYEIPFKSSRIRVGVQAFIDINIHNRQLVSVQGLFHYGFPIGGGKRESAPLQSLAAITHDERNISIYLPETYLDFKENEPTEISRKILREFAELLSQENTDWEKMTVESHVAYSDAAQAKKWSDTKADNVLKGLVFFGVTTQKAKAMGQGSEIPKFEAPEKAPFNTRIELQIIGVKDVARLKEQLSRILQKYEP